MSDTEENLNDPIYFARMLANRIGIPVSTEDAPTVRDNLNQMFKEAFTHGAINAQAQEVMACSHIIAEVLEEAMKNGVGEHAKWLHKCHEKIIERIVK